MYGEADLKPVMWRRAGGRIGKVDDLFVDENDNPEYIGVKMGFLGTNSTLIPMDIAQVDDGSSRITVSSEKQTVKDGPTFDDDRPIPEVPAPPGALAR